VREMLRTSIVLVPGKKYPETGVILESEFCMVQNPCLSKSHTKFGLQDHPCFRILLAWDKYLRGPGRSTIYPVKQQHISATEKESKKTIWGTRKNK